MRGTGRQFWKTDGFSTVVVTLLFLLAAAAGSTFLERIERSAYDAGVARAADGLTAKDPVAIIAIDDVSVEKIGRWPWSRGVLADVITQLGQAKPKAIGLQIFLSEPQLDPGLAHLRKVSAFFSPARLKTLGADAAELELLLKEADGALDQDVRLAGTLPVAENVVLPMAFTLGVPLGRPDTALPEFVSRNRLQQVAVADGGGSALQTVAALYPLHRFGSAAAGIAHMNVAPDIDGAVRSEALVLEHFGQYYPSLALMLAAKRLNLGVDDIAVELGRGVRLGRLAIETDSDMLMYTGFYPATGEAAPYRMYSFFDVYSGKVPMTVFTDKTVLIGATALGVGTTQVTPVSTTMSGPELTAHTLTSILNQHFFTRPQWAPLLELGLFVAVFLYLLLALPRLGAAPAAGISLAAMAAMIVLGQAMLTGEHLWVKTATPALLLLTGHVWLTTKRFFATERGKAVVETDSAQTSRMLGLAFQGQGQLDMALDKFRSLPIDDSVCDLLSNLALDFERKRQFSKAIAAYDCILAYAPTFKDVRARRERAAKAEGALAVGGKTAAAGGTLVLDSGAQKPTLGRYEIERELGRGAMGAVYLGRDPKINRVVAIKTMALAEEFADTELAEVKSRFFREAETAGRLNHPNIVTIYDAGEEQDLAYIAMEYLTGRNLSAYISRARLLPIPAVLQMIAKLADALDYAHKQDVVHRDIKPANIMFDPATQALKITDFGIARITASSRTRTGVIMGTPSYMSPEQLAGKHVDGRSDLFSLGVMLYEMLTATQPFVGDSMATLMFRIANEPHPDILAARRELNSDIRAVIDKALHKDPAQRYATGADIRAAIMQCQQARIK